MTDDRIVPLTVFAAVPVSDLEASADWYTRLIGRKPDHRPAPGVADYFLAGDRDPHKGTLQLMTDAQRAGGGLAIINIADTEPLLDALAGDGFAVTTQRFDIDAAAGVHVVVSVVLDPDGNAIHFVQPPRAG